uniref:Uncharacterized protein n=1 Tax=Onchocerca volvulus TaxID=6282 RepID=A0A8R1Y1F5_ONCVO
MNIAGVSENSDPLESEAISRARKKFCGGHLKIELFPSAGLFLLLKKLQVFMPEHLLEVMFKGETDLVQDLMVGCDGNVQDEREVRKKRFAEMSQIDGQEKVRSWRYKNNRGQRILPKYQDFQFEEPMKVSILGNMLRAFTYLVVVGPNC